MVAIIKFFGVLSIIVGVILIVISFGTILFLPTLMPLGASALLGGALLIAFARVVELLEKLNSKPDRSDRWFVAEGVLKDFPYRLWQKGTIEAMMPGGLVHFRDMEQFLAAAEGRDALQTKPPTATPAPSTTYRGYTYFAREDGVELKLKHHGETRQFPSEEECVAYIDAITG